MQSITMVAFLHFLLYDLKWLLWLFEQLSHELSKGIILVSFVDLVNVQSLSSRLPVLPLKSPVKIILPDDEYLAISNFRFQKVSSGSNAGV